MFTPRVCMNSCIKWYKIFIMYQIELKRLGSRVRSTVIYLILRHLKVINTSTVLLYLWYIAKALRSIRGLFLLASTCPFLLKVSFLHLPSIIETCFIRKKLAPPCSSHPLELSLSKFRDYSISRK